MNKIRMEILKSALDMDLNDKKAEIFKNYMQFFLEKNSHTNLISKNDENLLFEKHIFDSLAIHKFLKDKEDEDLKRLLDIGTGGGFPSVPIAIYYDKMNIFALDSIRKKINLMEELKTELELTNLFPICDRAENLPLKSNRKAFDYVTTRAVAPLEAILKYAIPNLKPEGYFIAYKSKRAMEELKEAERTIKLLGVEMVDIIEYKLPLEEIYERNLIIFRKK